MPGTDHSPDELRALVGRRLEAENRHDFDSVIEMLHEDFVFEDTTPPAGERHVGREAIRAFLTRMYSDAPTARVEIETMLVSGDCVTVTWRYTWARPGSNTSDSGFVRGIEINRFREHKVVEVSAYVKG